MVAVVEPAQLGSVSIRRGKGLHVVFVGRRPYTLVVFFRKGVRLCASAVFVSFEVPVVLRNQDPSVAVEVMSHWTRTNILHPLAHLYMVFLPPYAYCVSFNVDSPCPHPSLEGRGDVVVVENVVLATLEWREGICSTKTHSIQENIKSKLLLAFFHVSEAIEHDGGW